MDFHEEPPTEDARSPSTSIQEPEGILIGRHNHSTSLMASHWNCRRSQNNRMGAGRSEPRHSLRVPHHAVITFGRLRYGGGG
eukprot:961833-Pyramimonas_sp.AAC.1